MDAIPGVYVVCADLRRGVTPGLGHDLIRQVWLVRQSHPAGPYRVRVVYFETCADLSEALARRRWMGRCGSSRLIALVEAHNPTWRDRFAELLWLHGMTRYPVPLAPESNVQVVP